MPSILIVCTANICRSPMGEGILKRLVEVCPDKNQWYIDSAGVWARYGNPPAPLSQLVMQNMGIDISSHRSQPVNKEFLRNFDLILTMESIHKEVLQNQYLRIAERIYMLSEMVGIIKDIGDPISGEIEDYQATADELDLMLSDGLDKILHTAILNQE
jgi:protein arginine phosphatase